MTFSCVLVGKALDEWAFTWGSDRYQTETKCYSYNLKVNAHTVESIQTWLPVENEMAGFDLVW